MQGANRRYDLIPWAAQNAVHPVTRMEHGEGAYIFDSEGRKYLDFSAQLVNVNLGHGHAKVVRAIQEQAARLCYIGPHFTTEARDKLGAKLAEIAPGDIATAFFTDSGSEANEIAMTIARLVTGRRKIMTRYRSYHGTTSGALSASGDPRRVAVGYEQPNVVRIFDPYCHRCSFKLSYPECGVQCAASVEEVIQREGPEQIAALLAEPMTAAAAGIDPPAEYFPMLRQICDRYGILLIADEVQSGFARTGKLFAMEHSGVEADIMTMAKSLANGMPLSAVVGTAEVMDSSGPGSLGGTYSGNPLSCAAALAVIDVIREENILERSTQMGEQLAARFAHWEERFAHVAHSRNQGSMAAFELVDANGKPDPAATAAVCAKAKELGLILLSCGFYSNTIRILVPLTVEPEVLEEGLAIIEKALESLA